MNSVQSECGIIDEPSNSKAYAIASKCMSFQIGTISWCFDGTDIRMRTRVHTYTYEQVYNKIRKKRRRGFFYPSDWVLKENVGQ